MAQIDVEHPAAIGAARFVLLARQHFGRTLLVTLIALGVASGVYVTPTLGASALAAVALGIPCLWLLWTHPEFGMVAMVLLTNSVIPSDVRLPMTNIELRDLAVVGMLGLLAARGLIRRNLTLPWWRVSGPLLAFLGVVLFSAVYAVFYANVVPNRAFNELRTLTYYTSFFVAAWGLTSRRRLAWLLVGLFLVADLTTGVVFLQQIPSTRNSLPLDSTWYRGQQSETDTALGAWYLAKQSGASATFGTVRVVPPGHVLMYLLTTVAFCLLLAGHASLRLRLLLGLQVVWLGTGLLLTYSRAQWLASLTALAVVFLLLPAHRRRRLVQVMAVIGFTALCALSLFMGEIESQARNNEFLTTLGARVQSVFSPQDALASDSLAWRIYETNTAIESIAGHPLVGVGLGNAYRSVTLYQEEGMADEELTRFIHNAYLYMAIKLGLPGLVIFLWFYGAFLLWGWMQSGRICHPQVRLLTIAVVGSGVGLLQWSLTTPHFFSTDSTLVVGLMVGLVAAAHSLEQV